MKTLILTPLQEEFDFLLHGCIRRGFQPEEAVVGKLPVVQLPELAITLALGGLGKAQFAVQSQHLLDVDSYWDLVICTGAGGALVDHLSVGDVVVATETVEHDIYNNFGSPIVPRFDSASTALASFKQAAQAIDTFKVHFAPVASGDEDVVDSERRKTIRQLTGKRRLIETVAGQLDQRFGMKTTFARDLWHLMNRIIRKILSHTVSVLMNMRINTEPLKLRLLVN